MQSPALKVFFNLDSCSDIVSEGKEAPFMILFERPESNFYRKFPPTPVHGWQLKSVPLGQGLAMAN